MRNVVGYLPGRKPAVVVAAHYDTKEIPGFVGANDGAAGTAAVLELARVLSRTSRRSGASELRFVLFDGEESPRGSTNFLRDGVRGSRAMRAHRTEVGPDDPARLPSATRPADPAREQSSDAALWTQLRAAARRVGVGKVFPNRTFSQIEDDHTPFAQAGIPAIDLIDFNYPPFHTTADTLDKISQRSLDAAGEAVLELVRGL